MIKLSREEEKLIIKLRKEEQQRRLDEWKPRSLDEYTDKEKIEAFIRLHNHALSTFKSTKDTKYLDEDEKQYAFEAIMALLSRPDESVWDVLNKFIQ